MKKARTWLLIVSTISYLIVFGGICTYIIFKLPYPFDWIVSIIWLAYILPQPISYYMGNGNKMNSQYIETGNSEVFSMNNFKSWDEE